MRLLTLSAAVFAVIPLAILCPERAFAETQIQRQEDGLVVTTDGSVIRLQPWAPGVIRVEAAPGKTLPPKQSFAVLGKPSPGPWKVVEDAAHVELRTANLWASVDKKTGLTSFADGTGKPLLSQKSMDFSPAENPAREGLKIHSSFERAPGERFFGGGVIGDNFRQPSTEINLQNDYLQMHLPMVYSTRGYGFFWDNTSRSKLKMDAGSLTWESPAGDLADFYVLAGPTADAFVANYRALTGDVELFPKWAYGFWYSRNAFRSQEQILEAAKTFRERKFPIDMLVQDYFFWKPTKSPDGTGWGAHEFTKDRYPDVKAMIQELHDTDHIHFMAVIWPKLDASVETFNALENEHALFLPQGDFGGPNIRYYDPFNPKAREIFGRHVMEKLLPIGLDGFWMDGAEPEMNKDKWAKSDETAAGPVPRVMTAYPLLHTTAVYEAQRKMAPDKRVVLLPRSAWVGEQRNGVCTWTSDVNMDWKTLAWQIEGLQNFSILGLPYITTDIGGYNSTAEADRELFVRWFQWGAFSPIFRVHGCPRPYPWDYGVEAEGILRSFTELRYRLLPYIYSGAGSISLERETLLRPLVMDFPTDATAVDRWDEFLFGRSILVCPVYKSSRESVAAVEDISDTTGAPKRVTATFGSLPVQQREISDTFNDVNSKRTPGTGIHFRSNPEKIERDTKSLRIEGVFTPRQSGDFFVEISGLGDAQANTKSVEIDGAIVEPTTPAEDWKFPAYPLHAEAGKPVKFAITTGTRNPGIRFVRTVPVKRDVYLPVGQDWYDFWTGERKKGGQTFNVDTPLAMIPLYVRAGAILPLGPDLQWAEEKPADPIELRVYRGASGSFTLYEDQGDGFGYKKGEWSTIPFKWDEAGQTLTIGARHGQFPGMLQNRTFHIVWVGPDHGSGQAVTAKPDETVAYAGKEVRVSAPR